LKKTLENRDLRWPQILLRLLKNQKKTGHFTLLARGIIEANIKNEF
jgi:hypothetical protein